MSGRWSNVGAGEGDRRVRAVARILDPRRSRAVGSRLLCQFSVSELGTVSERGACQPALLLVGPAQVKGDIAKQGKRDRHSERIRCDFQRVVIDRQASDQQDESNHFECDQKKNQHFVLAAALLTLYDDSFHAAPSVGETQSVGNRPRAVTRLRDCTAQ